jgi:hypothetical protein
MNQRRTQNAALMARRVQGTVIFDNTPRAANVDAIR